MQGPEERALAIAAPAIDADAALSGLWLRAARGAGDESEARGGAIVAAPHPLYGGSMEHPVCAELAHRCCRARIASLRFDWRGVGASAGLPSGSLDDAADDCAAALAQLAESVDAPLVACGYSFGAAAVLRLASRATTAGPDGARIGLPRLRRLVLVAPPPALFDVAALHAFRGRSLLVAASDDGIASARELEAIARGHDRIRFERVEDADHFFVSGLAELGAVVERFLAGEADAG